jgi:CopG family transcriptional regulator, nickel-responsive regulator
MSIVSVSLNEDVIKEIAELERELGFRGRSEVVRAGVRVLAAEEREKIRLKGRINAVLIVVHGRAQEDAVNKTKHDFEDVIETQVHSHLKDEKCLEVFVLDGDAERVKRLVKTLQKNARLEYAKLVVA